MSILAIVPVKPLRQAKSRLSPVLRPRQRYELALAMLKHVLQVATSTPAIAGLLVVSRDAEALTVARDLGADAIQEGADSDLNSALRQATDAAIRQGASGVLILPADLPFVRGADLEALTALGGACRIVIAADQARDGTNALLTQPPGLIPYAYGRGSFRKHLQNARRAGAETRVYSSRRLALDIDNPRDLEAYHRELDAGEHSHLPRFDLLPDAVN